MFVNSYWIRKLSLKLLPSLDASCIFYWMMWRTSSCCFRRSQSYRLIAPLFRPSQFKVSTINYTLILTQSNFISSNSWDAGMSILLLDVLLGWHSSGVGTLWKEPENVTIPRTYHNSRSCYHRYTSSIHNTEGRMYASLRHHRNKKFLIHDLSIALNITSTPTGCALTGAIPTKAVLWIPALILEPILCMLVLYRSWRTLGSLGNYWTANTLVAVVARDRYVPPCTYAIHRLLLA